MPANETQFSHLSWGYCQYQHLFCKGWRISAGNNRGTILSPSWAEKAVIWPSSTLGQKPCCSVHSPIVRWSQR